MSICWQPERARIWTAHDGPIPGGPYSFITASASCTPDSATGLVILELP